MNTQVATVRSRRSFQMEMAKLNRVYDAEISARNTLKASWHGRGVAEGDFDTVRKHEAAMTAALVEMDRVHAEAKAAGHYVSSGWHKYHHSTYAQLVSENRD